MNYHSVKKITFRTWKSGKIWLYGTSLLACLVLSGGLTTIAQADTPTLSSSSSLTQTSSSEKSSTSQSSTSSSTTTTLSTTETSTQAASQSTTTTTTTAPEIARPTSTTSTSPVAEKEQAEVAAQKTVQVTSTPKITAPSNLIGKIGQAIDLSKNVTTVDSAGNPVAFSDLTVEVDNGSGNELTLSGSSFIPKFGGDYTISYTYVDVKTGIVANSQTILSIPPLSTPSLLVPSDAIGKLNQPFNLATNVSGKNASGTTLNFSDLEVQVTDANNNTIPLNADGETFTPTHGGDYYISYIYTDTLTGQTASANRTISVTAQQPLLSVPNSASIPLNSSYDLTKGLSGTDSTGKAINPSDVMISIYRSDDEADQEDDSGYAFLPLNPDGKSFTPNQTGNYSVIYTFTDPITGATVIAHQDISVTAATILSPQITIPLENTGQKGVPFDVTKGLSATDSLGNVVDPSQIDISVQDFLTETDIPLTATDGHLTFTPTGSSQTYLITYQLTDETGATTEATQIVEIPPTALPTVIAPSNSIGQINQAFDVSKNVSLIDEAGHSVTFDNSALDLSGSTDPLGNPLVFAGKTFIPTGEGDYNIVYSFTDPENNDTATAFQDVYVPYTKTPVIFVPSDTVGQINQAFDVTKNLVITNSAGKAIAPDDENVYISVLDADGNDVDLNDDGLSFTPNKQGEYQVIYTYIDPTNNNRSYATQNVWVGELPKIPVLSNGNDWKITLGEGQQSVNFKPDVTASDGSAVDITVTVQNGGTSTRNADGTYKLTAGTYLFHYESKSLGEYCDETISVFSQTSGKTPTKVATSSSITQKVIGNAGVIRAEPLAKSTQTIEKVIYKSTVTATKKLPTTNAKSNAGLLGLGAAIISAALGLSARRLKKKND